MKYFSEVLWDVIAEERNFQKATKLLSFCSVIYLIVHTYIKSSSLNKLVGSIAKKKYVKWTEDGLPLTRLSISVKNQNSDHKTIFFVVCWLLTLKTFSESLKSSVSLQCAFSYWFSIFNTTLLIILQYPLLLREAFRACLHSMGRRCLALGCSPICLPPPHCGPQAQLTHPVTPSRY